MSRLTVVTITYNAGPWLVRTLQSVAEQTSPPDEYLIVDGGSTDHTLDLIRQHAHLVSHWHSEPDGGIYDAMNKGLARASGDFVWFMNAGDSFYDATAVARVRAAIRPDTDVVYGETLYVRPDGTAVGLRSAVTPHRLPNGLTWRDFRRGMVVCHQAFVARKTVAPLYDLRHPYSADVDWEIRCLQRARGVVRAEGVLARYLTGGFSKQHHRRSLLDRYAVLKRHFGFWPNLWHHAQIVTRRVG